MTFCLGRLAQTNTATEYFLGDALGSIRQLTAQNGQVTLAKSYTPYGEVTSSSGNSSSPFAYTGEQMDATGLTYLRARYYSPLDGRFMSRDTRGGGSHNPITFNKWAYANDNPVMLSDPSGNCPWCPILPIIIIIIIGTTGCSSESPISPPPMPTLKSLVGITDAPVILEETESGQLIRSHGPTKNPQRVSFGDLSSNTYGINFFANLNVPSGLDGTLEWVQNIKEDLTIDVNRGAPVPPLSTPWALDDEAVYPNNGSVDISPSFSGDVSMWTEDTPFIPFYGRFTHVHVREDFRMYIMWHPRGGAYEQRIPIAKLEWSWEVTAENQSSTDFDWAIISQNQNPIGSGVGSQTSEMPVLTPNIFDYPFPSP